MADSTFIPYPGPIGHREFVRLDNSHVLNKVNFSSCTYRITVIPMWQQPQQHHPPPAGPSPPGPAPSTPGSSAGTPPGPIMRPTPPSQVPAVAPDFHPPLRPSFGAIGRPIVLRANHFQVRETHTEEGEEREGGRERERERERSVIIIHLFLQVKIPSCVLYHYDVAIIPDKCPRRVNREIIEALIGAHADYFGHQKPVFDGRKNLYSRRPLPIGRDRVSFSVMTLAFSLSLSLSLSHWNN